MNERRVSGESVLGTVAQEAARLLDAMGAAPAHVPACEHCGSQPAATRACHLCPVCRLLSVIPGVRPETVDQLADLAAAVAESLRELAAARRADPRQARPSGAPGSGAGDATVVSDGEQPAGGKNPPPERSTR